MESVTKVLDLVDSNRRIYDFVLGGQAHFQRDSVRAEYFLASYGREYRPNIDLSDF